ncbi:MAG: DMT family transporter [Bacteroidota bacterium]|jgi:drug/metabolite transporter (DMT)-like permease|nr:DMT family transporter [Bacteroidota bacterium]
MKSVKRERVAYFSLTLMTLIVGFSFIFVKIALRHASPIDLLAHRFSAAFVGIFLYYLIRGKGFPRFERKSVPSLLLLSVFYPILLFLLQTIGLQFTTASEAGIISATAPIFTLILASIFLKERSTIWQIFSFFLSVGGVIFIMYRNGLGVVTGETLKGDFIILLSVFSIAIYLVLARRATRKHPAMNITFFMTVVACVLFNLLAVTKHVQQNSLSLYFAPFQNGEFLWSILYLGVLSSFLTSFLTNTALSVIPASRASIFNNLSPVITVFAGVLVLGETLRGYHLVGGLMVLLGIIGVNVLKREPGNG